MSSELELILPCLGALSAGRDMGIVGVACIFSTVILIDGPLLQRASTVASMHMPSSQPLSIKMAPELPHGWSGGWSTTELLGIDNTHPNPAFNSTIPTAGGSSRNDITTGELLNAKCRHLEDPLIFPFFGI